MHGVLSNNIARARKIERSILQGTAEVCSPAFGKACKGLWPVKTAEELAARAGCSVRAAAYQLSGEHEPSIRAVQALLNAIIPAKRP